MISSAFLFACFKDLLILLYVHGCFPFMGVRDMCFWSWLSLEEGSGFSGTGVPGCYESPCGSQETNSDPMWAQPMLVTTGPPLQFQNPLSFISVPFDFFLIFLCVLTLLPSLPSCLHALLPFLSLLVSDGHCVEHGETCR